MREKRIRLMSCRQTFCIGFLSFFFFFFLKKSSKMKKIVSLYFVFNSWLIEVFLSKFIMGSRCSSVARLVQIKIFADLKFLYIGVGQRILLLLSSRISTVFIFSKYELKKEMRNHSCWQLKVLVHTRVQWLWAF